MYRAKLCLRKAVPGEGASGFFELETRSSPTRESGNEEGDAIADSNQCRAQSFLEVRARLDPSFGCFWDRVGSGIGCRPIGL